MESGSTVVSVNDIDEHKFIRDWLQKNDARKDSWWTSGLTSKKGGIRWQGDGTTSNYDGGWKVPAKEYLVDDEKVIYSYVENSYGWKLSDTNVQHSFICEINLKEVHRIGQEARDYDYGLNVATPSLAPKGPKFLVQPESTTILGDTTLAFFDCVASGNPEPSYEWFKEGSNGMEPLQLGGRFTTISGRLNIENPNSNDENEIQCKASNKYGSIWSRPVVLSFGNLGQFSPVAVGTVSAPEFHGTQLECPVITGKPAITYQWYKDTAANFIRPLKQVHTFISSTGKLFFSELEVSDEGTYYCIASLISLGSSQNYAGSSQGISRTSVGFPLKVQKSGGNEYDPDIQKDFIFVYPRLPKKGMTIKLECFAYGTGPLVYTWTKARGDFPKDRYYFKWNNRYLIIRNVQMSDEDVYTCEVTSTKTKNIDTTSLALKIQAEPYFIYPLDNQHVDIGASLTWHCEALGSPLPTYKWYRNGVELPRSIDGIEINSNTLYIDKLEPKQSGMYQCGATNQLGTTFSSGQLRVLQVAPSFEKTPMTKFVAAARGGNVRIHCNPIGAPRPVFTWSHNGNILNVQPGVYSEEDHYRLSLDGDLMIVGINAADKGRYTCSVTNVMGVAEDYSVVDVIEGATFSVMPADDKVEVNLTAVLLCQGSYPPERDVVYEWKFNDHVINFEREMEYSLGVGSQEGYLYVGPAQFMNEGWYTCSLLSSLERKSESCYLEVLGPPGEPAGVNVRSEPFSEMGAETAAETAKFNPATTRYVTWMDGKDNGDRISNYFVQFRSDFNENWRVHPDGNNIPRSLVTLEQFNDMKVRRLTNLKAGASVQFRVIARNAFGLGTPSLPTAQVQILGAIPTARVKNVRGGGGSVGDLTINWDPLPVEDHNGADFKYLVRWRTYSSGVQSDTAQWREETIKLADACGNDFTLDSGMVYMCRFVTTVGSAKFYLPFQAQVVASNKYGDGPPSNTSVVMSAEEMPLGTAENVKAKIYNATALMVTWTPAQNTRESMRGKLKGYKVNYWRMGVDKENRALQLPIGLKEGQENLNQGMIIGLEPMTWYSFNVQSYNSAGNGPKSSTYQQQTRNKVPGLYPTEVHVYSIKGVGVRVNFRGVSTLPREEPLQGYKVQVWEEYENIHSARYYNVGKSNTGVLRNLTEGIIYQLRVFGYSRAGQGKRSSPSIYFTVGGGEMRINLETTELQSGVSYLIPSRIATALVSIITATVIGFKLLS